MLEFGAPRPDMRPARQTEQWADFGGPGGGLPGQDEI